MQLKWSLPETSANLLGRSSSSENYIDVIIWHLFENVTGNCSSFARQSHFVNEISNELAAPEWKAFL